MIDHVFGVVSFLGDAPGFLCDCNITTNSQALPPVAENGVTLYGVRTRGGAEIFGVKFVDGICRVSPAFAGAGYVTAARCFQRDVEDILGFSPILHEFHITVDGNRCARVSKPDNQIVYMYRCQRSAWRPQTTGWIIRFGSATHVDLYVNRALGDGEVIRQISRKTEPRVHVLTNFPPLRMEA